MSPMRWFDPRAVGALECRAWETYYRRKWGAFLLASVGLVLRANQVWAPFPDNDSDAARALMKCF